MSIPALQRSKKSHHYPAKGRGRLLITVNVLGSAGPLRFLVNEEELVAAVIDTALRSYAREGRLPVLGSDLNNFLLYSANAGSDGKGIVSVDLSCLFFEFLRMILEKKIKFLGFGWF